METKKVKVSGMSCASCGNKIERNLSHTLGVKKVNVSYSNDTCQITYDTSIIALKDIIQVIENLGYQIIQNKTKSSQQPSKVTRLLGLVVLILALYIIMQQSGVTNIFNAFPQAKEGMGYGMLFLIGLLTSVHCVAMCGGINLSQCIPTNTESNIQGNQLSSIKPSVLYNVGRIISYTAIGAIVGTLGSVISFSGEVKSIVQIIAGIFMVIMGLNMLNIFPWLRKLNPRIPKIFTRKIHVNKSNNSPLYVGLLNGLMPCGPLQAMQLYALSTGNPVKGALSMFLFSLGTVPLMFGLGVLSSILSQKFTRKVMSVGSALVVVLGVSMFSNGLSLSGFTFSVASFIDSGNGNQAVVQGDLQTVNTSLNSGEYDPITVQVGIPVRWTITAKQGALNGCNNEIFIPEYGIEKKFEIGENVVEFTPTKAGTFVYSCWMGMISSTITVVEEMS